MFIWILKKYLNSYILCLEKRNYHLQSWVTTVDFSQRKALFLTWFPDSFLCLYQFCLVSSYFLFFLSLSFCPCLTVLVCFIFPGFLSFSSRPCTPDKFVQTSINKFIEHIVFVFFFKGGTYIHNCFFGLLQDPRGTGPRLVQGCNVVVT